MGLVREPVLEVEPSGPWLYTATGSGRSGNDAVARGGDVSEAFARWLHHRDATCLAGHGRTDLCGACGALFEQCSRLGGRSSVDRTASLYVRHQR